MNEANDVSLKEYVDVRFTCVNELVNANEKVNAASARQIDIKIDALREKTNDNKVQSSVTAAFVSLLISLVMAWLFRK